MQAQYLAVPENLEKVRKYGRDRYAKPEVKTHIRQYLQIPEVRENRRIKSTNKARILRAIDPLYRLKHNLRTRLSKAIEYNYKSGSAVRDLGCTGPELKDYLESKFQPGMTWGNYGLWHIDHIKPLSSFDLNNREQFLQANHYTNLQPLWAVDNIRKGAK